ncbi:MAG TPA: NAD(P)/FAD-dependent oxidoreductase [Caldithrix abyssi]|uniref:NAD(P)/FAD-dependent oxidoreductase n=1 Tax=Caldithrix abyssi TaxID=187145 RepID=A0A7V1LMJ1_CALAY|nr:NAD(P)/FAD-dependent oxidoreductase [Caldithrix abyssi]
MEQFDVVILGAGPAGSVLARLLAEKSHKVLLVEKDAYAGKTTACGGLFDKPYFDRYVNDPKIMEQHIRRNVFKMPWGDVTYDCDQVTVKRRIFDRFLADRAGESGADYRTRTRAVDWKRIETGHIEVQLQDLDKKEKYTVRAKVVAFADGPHTLAKKNPRFDHKKNRKNWAYAYAYEMQGLATRPDEMIIYLDKALFPWGYGWIFPDSDVSNIGVGTIQSEIDKGIKVKEKLFEFINSYAASAPLLKAREITDKKGGFIPMWLIDHYSDDSQLVLGDAAGMVSPLFGAGIDYAIDAAEAAAATLEEALAGQAFDAATLSAYDRRLKEGFIIDLRKQMLVARIIINSLKFGAQWPVKILAVIAFGGKYNRWNKIKILLYPLLGRPEPVPENGEILSHK